MTEEILTDSENPKLELPQKKHVLKPFQEPSGRFKKGTHWRNSKPYWDKGWLYRRYVVDGRSSKEIADEFGCRDSNILYFLGKFGIKARTTDEARRIKHWGSTGSSNPMYGRLGFLSPRWNGGHSPERQSVYARHFWKELAKSILKRDGYCCRKCGTRNAVGNRLEVHHIKPWSAYPELRFEQTNLMTLCHHCHAEVTREEVKARKK